MCIWLHTSSGLGPKTLQLRDLAVAGEVQSRGVTSLQILGLITLVIKPTDGFLQWPTPGRLSRVKQEPC